MDTYEEKYNEALEKARQLCAYPTTKPFINDLQNLFPELKDSEDETIRKGLIRYFSTFRLGTFAGIEPKKIIDWLERQGEQKPWSEEDEREIEHCIDFLNHPDMIRTTPTVVKGCKNWLTFPLTDEDVEYVRADVLIEKAQSFLTDKLKEIPIGFGYKKIKADCSLKEFTHEFIEYIKGE